MRPGRYRHGRDHFAPPREDDPEKRCNVPHPVYRGTLCNGTEGHDGPHGYTSPADGRSISWQDDVVQDVF